MLAEAPLPGFDNSQMDGYAVRSADTAGATEREPVELPVVGDIPAGARSPRGVTRGLCLRIMTGAPMPAGADAVEGRARELSAMSREEIVKVVSQMEAEMRAARCTSRPT